jgi:hypothetical protein
MAQAKTKTKNKKTAVTTAQKILTELEAFGGQRFYFCNGQIAAKLKELPQILRELDDSTYNYHVNIVKNDLASWIGDVFQKKDIAAKVRQARGRAEMAAVLEKALVL